MNKLSFLQGYLAKKSEAALVDEPADPAVKALVDQVVVPADADEAALMAERNKSIEKTKKKGIHKELKKMEAALAVMRAAKKQKELALYDS